MIELDILSLVRKSQCTYEVNEAVRIIGMNLGWNEHLDTGYGSFVGILYRVEQLRLDQQSIVRANG